MEKDTNADVIKEFLAARQFTIRELECVSNDNARFKSFKLTVPVTQYGKLFDENLWPRGVCVRKYIPPRSDNS